MCYTVAPSPGHLVQAALPCLSEHCPGQQTDSQVSVSAQRYEEVPGLTWAGEVGKHAGLEGRLPQHPVRDCLLL